MNNSADCYIALLHDGMDGRHGSTITTSLTLIDVHDIARSARTYGLKKYFIAHPSENIKKLGRGILKHWVKGFGATYNPNRSDALSFVEIVSSFNDIIARIEELSGSTPIIVSTSAKSGGDRVTFNRLRKKIKVNKDNKPYLIMLGTGNGMGKELLSKANIFLEPIKGSSDYNHLSVRSAAAIILDRLFQ